MRKPSRLTQLIVATLAVFSMVATTTPASAGVISNVSIAAKKKTLTAEQKKAKAAVAAAEKTLKAKEKALASATKALAKADKNLAKAQAKAAKFKSVVKSSTKTKAMKSLTSAQRVRDRAAALVDSRTRARDKALADLTKKQAKYGWLMQDLTAMDCGAGTQIQNTNGALETVYECGIVYDINDGDTVWVKTTKNEIVEVRNIGLQTPELKKQSGYAEQCGATLAKNNMLSMLTPEVSVVQLRSITSEDNKWGGFRRPERSIWALNPVTGLFDIDVQAAQMKAGLSFFWPSSREWTHNKEYLGYLLDARATGLGIWNPNLCGAVGEAPSLYLNANAPTIGADVEPAFGEYVLLNNPTGSNMDISGWSLRDGSLDFFSLNGNWEFDKSRFPAGTVIPAGGTLTVYISNPAGYGLTANETSYFRSDWRMPAAAQIANAYLATSTNPEYAHGDGVYLLDPHGNVRASMLSTCSPTVLLCDKPAWVTDLQTSTASHIIPWPITLSMVAAATQDTYNPVVSLGANISATKASLSSLGFTVGSDASVLSSQATGTQVGITVTSGSTNVAGTRVPLAVLPANTAKTSLSVMVASGNNAVPSLTGLTRQAAHDALVAAGFANTLTGDPAAIVASEPTLSGGCSVGSCAVGTTISIP